MRRCYPVWMELFNCQNESPMGIGISSEMTKSEALKLEYRIKQLPADKKISKLKREENVMAILKKDLQSLQKEIKALGRKMDKLINEFDKDKKANVKKKATAKPAKSKITKKAPAKKAPVKKGPAKPTATDQVLNIISGSKNGVNTATMMKKTGFDQRKIWSIVNRAAKAGKIKRAGRGIYIDA